MRCYNGMGEGGNKAYVEDVVAKIPLFVPTDELDKIAGESEQKTEEEPPKK
ncbi:hypothetical protein ACFL0W_03845 [Nanoarchaeota archaeon]